jgi:hypothetical protein
VRDPAVIAVEGGLFDEMICPDRIEWLPKRAKASAPFRTVDRSEIPPE